MDVWEPIANRLRFASEAEWLALSGLVCWLGAAFCLVMDRVRGSKRSVEKLEKVGFMPWTSLFVALAIIGGGCLAVSLPVVLGRL